MLKRCFPKKRKLCFLTCFISLISFIPPKTEKNVWFSNIFREYRKRPVVRKRINTKLKVEAARPIFSKLIYLVNPKLTKNIFAHCYNFKIGHYNNPVRLMFSHSCQTEISQWICSPYELIGFYI